MWPLKPGKDNTDGKLYKIQDNMYSHITITILVSKNS